MKPLRVEMDVEKETPVSKVREKGIALITSLLILLLISTMIVGLSWLVMGDQKLGGNNNDRQLAFYGAEGGMEQLTATLENSFDANYAQSCASITALNSTPGPPTNIPGVQYLNPDGTSGYTILCQPSTTNPLLPASSFSTIPTGLYAGLVGLMTPYTLQVTSRTTYGSEVRLQREVQTVGIPVFQFGIFSQTDLSFFAGPDFNFGGRVHTNGNLWLAEGGTLTLANKVTTAGELITSNLENGWPTSSGYTGAVDITTGSGLQDITAQTPFQSVTGTSNSVGNISAINEPAFLNMDSSVYNNNIAIKETPVTPLNLAIATPAIGGQPIDLIRRPVKNEDTANPGKLSERYYNQVSIRILLSDYGPSGGCTDSDISSASTSAIPHLSANLASPVTPIDLATLAWDHSAPSANANTKVPYYSPPSWLTNVGTTTFPLPVSGAQGGSTYNGGTKNDGYWVAQYYPAITGCIKIDYQTTAGGVWTDVTPTVLNLGYTGRDINPQSSNNPASPFQPGLPGSQVKASGPTANAGVATITCTDPSPNAVIRLARVRDNPSWIPAGGGCPAPPSAASSTHGYDYWPNVLFDTREALLQDPSPVGLANSQLPAGGAMYYVELDVAKLAACLTSTTTCPFSSSVNNATGYSVYFSDRRGERPDPSPPASVGTTSMLTGGYGWEDNVNFVAGVSAANGCPNGTLDQGEDVESDYNSSGVSMNAATTPRTYANILSTLTAAANPSSPSALWPIYDSSLATPAVTGTELGGTSATPGKAVWNLISAILVNNPTCTGPLNLWPLAVAANPGDLRQNPPIFYRRALKVLDGSTITLGTCNSVPCGLTVVSENPVYLQGDYNNPGLNTSFTGTGVGASIIADAVTLLSDNWNDVNSFAFPYLSNTDGRKAVTTTYRLAIAAGKGLPWLNSSGTIYQDFGTDGGTHNFLRQLEDWGGQTLYYQGSIVSMYYNHQAVGTYKCCQNVYNPPTRGYNFDTNFLTPALLPPLTPMLRTINTIGSTQMMLPTE